MKLISHITFLCIAIVLSFDIAQANNSSELNLTLTEEQRNAIIDDIETQEEERVLSLFAAAGIHLAGVGVEIGLDFNDTLAAGCEAVRNNFLSAKFQDIGMKLNSQNCFIQVRLDQGSPQGGVYLRLSSGRVESVGFEEFSSAHHKLTVIIGSGFSRLESKDSKYSFRLDFMHYSDVEVDSGNYAGQMNGTANISVYYHFR